MTNETNKQLSETKQLRGTFGQVIHQINESYNSSNGWAIVRYNNSLVNFTVWIERSVKQGEALNWESKLVPTLGSVVNRSETPEKDIVNTEVETKVAKTSPKTSIKKTTEKKDV